MAADDSSGGGGERPQWHPLVGWFLTCAILVGFGVFMAYTFERALYQAPEFKATVSAYEGLDAPAAGAGTAPTFRVALRVGENLFNFMQSFCGADGGKLVVPTDILDRWFRKFQERAKKDPMYLKSFDF